MVTFMLPIAPLYRTPGQLDNDIRSALTDLPNRTIIVYHPAFGYFAADYGLTMIALEEEGKEAAAVDLQRVIDLARAQNIKVVFYQAEIDSKQSRTLAEEIGGQAGDDRSAGSGLYRQLAQDGANIPTGCSRPRGNNFE